MAVCLTAKGAMLQAPPIEHKIKHIVSYHQSYAFVNLNYGIQFAKRVTCVVMMFHTQWAERGVALLISAQTRGYQPYSGFRNTS